jgi:sulfoacetaldehyde acetyltransferase
MMSAGEAITEVLVSREVDHVFSITGSAFLPASDCFETAGIRLVHVQHEQNAGFALDGYVRVSPGKTVVTLNQAGPGASNLLTSFATSYWNHAPVVAITPTVDSHNDGKGVFQELPGQDRVFQDQVKYLGNVTRADRITEILGKGLDRALSEQGPVQVNIPRDFFNAEEEYAIPRRVVPQPSPANAGDIEAAAELIRSAENPVLLAGAGIGWSETGSEELMRLAEALQVPVVTSYLHNDVFPASHPLNVGSLGYFGARSAMRCVENADLVIALGTRLGPFSVTKQDNIDYWSGPHTAGRKLVQVDHDATRLGLSCDPDLAIRADAGLCAGQLADALLAVDGSETTPHAPSATGAATAAAEKARWATELEEMTETTTIPENGAMAPRKALKVLGDFVHALPHGVLSTDIGNVSSQMNQYAKFENSRSYLAPGLYGSCGYSVGAAMGAKVASPERDVFALVGDGAFMMNPVCELLTLIREEIPITIVVAHNNMWWAEGLNCHLYFDQRYGGCAIDSDQGRYAGIARSMGDESQIQGIAVDQIGDLQGALEKGTENQRAGITTIVEIAMTAEPTPIFRADAMVKPYRFLEKYSHLTTRE